MLKLKKVVTDLEGKYDILIGAFHLGQEGEKGASGGADIAEALPQFDAIFLGHAHAKIDEEINGVKILEPGKYGWGLAKASFELQKGDNGYDIITTSTENLETKAIEEDAEMIVKYKYVHDKAVMDANKIVGAITADFIKNQIL